MEKEIQFKGERIILSNKEIIKINTIDALISKTKILLIFTSVLRIKS